MTNKDLDKSKYKLKLSGTVSDGKYTQAFTEKNVTFIEFEFGNKKIDIGIKSLEQENKQLKEDNKTQLDNMNFQYERNTMLEQKLEKFKKLYDDLVDDNDADTLPVRHLIKAILKKN